MSSLSLLEVLQYVSSELRDELIMYMHDYNNYYTCILMLKVIPQLLVGA